TNLKKKISDKYCPRGEIKKLEVEMWNLKVKESDKIKKYVSGLPDMIHESVKASKTSTMQDAIEFTTKLMDKKISTFTERQDDNKRKFDDTSKNNQNQLQPTKRQNVARAYTAGSGYPKILSSRTELIDRVLVLQANGAGIAGGVKVEGSGANGAGIAGGVKVEGSGGDKGDLGLNVLVFKHGDDPNDSIHHMMSLLTSVVTSRYPTTNNHLKNSSNPRQQATINDGRVTLQPVQGRQTTFVAEEGNMSKQCTKPKRKQDDSWFKDKVLLVQAQANGQILHDEELAFLADLEILEGQATQTINMDNKSVNDTLTAELEGYKEQVKVLKEGKNIKKAQQLEPKLYDGNVLKNTCAIVIPDSEEILMLAEESRLKMILKQQDPMVLEKKVNTTPVDYAVLNQLSQYFEK
nr:hypothetical protein [Tanacetum cinerariifolium]